MTARPQGSGDGSSKFVASLLGLTWAVSACAGADEAGMHRFTVTVEDDVEVALTTGGPKYEGELFEYEKVLEIRPDPDVEESLLYSPRRLAIADDGRVFVTDTGDEQVVVFDEDGAYLYRIGRAGEGPGEFRDVGFVEIVDDVLWVTDDERHHAFRLDGTFLETVTLPIEARSLMGDGRWWRLPDGGGIVSNLERRLSERSYQNRAEMYVVGPEGETLATATTPWITTAELLDQEVAGRPVFANRFFAGRPWATYRQGHGLFLTDPREPEVPVYNDAGELSRRLRVDLPPQPVAEEDRAWVMEQLDDLVRRADEGDAFENNPRMARIQRDNPRFADPKHYWSRVIVDDRGFVWLGLHNARDLPDGSSRWIVLSPEGEYLGKTTTPGYPQPQRGRMLTVLDDPGSGEEYPAVFRIRPTVEGLEY